MNLVLYFFIAFGLSFLGTLPIGLITLSITQRTIQNGKRSGVMIALGATIMEFIYTVVALISLDFFSQNNDTSNYIKYAATFIFLALGIYYIFKKNNTTPNAKSTAYNYLDFFRGIIVGAMNMLIIPFWVFLGLWLRSHGFIFDQHLTITVFSLGAALGALLAFGGYILLSDYVNKKSELINRYTNKAVGLLFLGLAIFQLIQLL